MGDAAVVRRTTYFPQQVLEDDQLCSKLASFTNLPPKAMLALQQCGVAHKQEWLQTYRSVARGGHKPLRAARGPPPKPAAPPSTPEPQLELPLLRTDSSGDVPAIVCPPGMQPVTPRALCKPLGAAALEPADSCGKAVAPPATPAGPGWATAARRPLLALGLQLALLPLLLASLNAVLGGPAEAPDASLASIRTWWIACSCTGTLLLLCTHAAYAKLGWRVGMALDALTLVLRAGACRSLSLLLPAAAVLLVCRLLLSGCALAWPASGAQAPKFASSHADAPNLHVQQWQKA